MTNLSSVLEKKKRTYIQERDKLDNLPIPNSYESRCIYGLHSIAVEHYFSILHLSSIGNWGSAFALLRLCREAYIRGSYLQYCSDENSWDKFSKGDAPNDSSKMIELVEQFLEQKNLFSSQDYKFLHDLTHTGIEHITRRTLRTSDAKSDYPEEEKISLLNCSEALAILAIASMIDLSSLPEDSKIELAQIVSLRP